MLQEVNGDEVQKEESNLGLLTSAPLARLAVVVELPLLLLISSFLRSVWIIHLKSKHHILGSKGAKGTVDGRR